MKSGEVGNDACYRGVLSSGYGRVINSGWLYSIVGLQTMASGRDTGTAGRVGRSVGR